MLVPQPPGQNRSATAKTARKPSPQAFTKPPAAELPKPPVSEPPVKPLAPPPSVELPVAPPPTIELPVTPPLIIAPEPVMAPPPAAAYIAPEPDYTLAGSAPPTEILSPPTDEMLVAQLSTVPQPTAPLPTMTPEPAMAQVSSAAAFNPEPATEFLSPLSIDLPAAAPVPITPEPVLAPSSAAPSFSPEPTVTEFACPLSVDQSTAAPVAITPEPPLETPPLVTPFDDVPLLNERFEPPAPEMQVAAAENFAEPTFDLPLSDQPVPATDQGTAVHAPAASFASYPLADQEASAAFASSPTVELSPSPTPTTSPEPDMVLLLPPPETDAPENEEIGSQKPRPHDDDRHKPQPRRPAVETYIDDVVTLRRSRGAEFLSWLHNHLPARPDHIPSDAIEPSWAERRTARGLAAALAGIALLSLLPVALTRHWDLRSAPPWALWTVLLAAVQLIFAGWLANAPDWATVRVQMIISAALTTLYAMAMTLMVLTPSTHELILKLDEVRPLGAAWCGLMFLLMGGATWYCGRTSTRWREQNEVERVHSF
jgi:hypothetical protein